MGMDKFKVYILLVLMCFSCVVVAQTPNVVITDYLKENSQGKIVVNQPESMNGRLKPKKTLLKIKHNCVNVIYWLSFPI